MSKFAPVAPINVLKALHIRHMLGDYHLVLSHDVLMHKEEFHELFSLPEYKNATIIVDNSVIELKTPVTSAAVIEAASIFDNKNVVAVLPDSLLNMEDTVALSYKALDYWKYMSYYKRFGFMFVPQGRTLDELVKCSVPFMEETKITHIGIARNITSCIGSRMPAIRLMQQLFPNKHLHLLGFSDDLIDDIRCAQAETIDGIDSAVPLRLGSNNKILNLYDYKHSPRGDWWQKANVTEFTYANIQSFRTLIDSLNREEVLEVLSHIKEKPICKI